MVCGYQECKEFALGVAERYAAELDADIIVLDESFAAHVTGITVLP